MTLNAFGSVQNTNKGNITRIYYLYTQQIFYIDILKAYSHQISEIDMYVFKRTSHPSACFVSDFISNYVFILMLYCRRHRIEVVTMYLRPHVLHVRTRYPVRKHKIDKSKYLIYLNRRFVYIRDANNKFKLKNCFQFQARFQVNCFLSKQN